jgi:hypothetical protein
LLSCLSNKSSQFVESSCTYFRAFWRHLLTVITVGSIWVWIKPISENQVCLQNFLVILPLSQSFLVIHMPHPCLQNLSSLVFSWSGISIWFLAFECQVFVLSDSQSAIKLCVSFFDAEPAWDWVIVWIPRCFSFLFTLSLALLTILMKSICMVS